MGSELVAVVAWKPLPTNLPLVHGLRHVGLHAELLTPREATHRLERGDVALVRLDVAASLDGVEPGLRLVDRLRRRGARLLNRPSGLLAAHDKWRTAKRLAAAGIPHPWTIHTTDLADVGTLAAPFVLEPRFGSWGQDVMRCRTPAERERSLAIVAERGWFHRHGVLVQELIAPCGRDLRLIVAGEQVVGASERHAAIGEWRTNFALGGHSQPLTPPPEARALAERAARPIGADLLSIDLLPLPDGRYAVLEANAAADFDAAGSLPGRDIYLDLAGALELVHTPHPKTVAG